MKETMKTTSWKQLMNRWTLGYWTMGAAILFTGTQEPIREIKTLVTHEQPQVNSVYDCCVEIGGTFLCGPLICLIQPPPKPEPIKPEIQPTDCGSCHIQN